MTAPGPGAEPYAEVYAGPPPTRRPEPWQSVPVQWAPAQWSPGQWSPGQGTPYPVAPYPVAPPYGWSPAPRPEVRRVPPPGTPPHDEPRSFLLAMRSRDWAWWRPLLGLLLIVVVWFVAAAVVLGFAFVTGIAPNLDLFDLVDPAVLLVTNLTLVVAVPSVWLAWAAAHGMRIGWSSSVLARLRWRLLLPFTAMALATLGIGIALSVLALFLIGEEEVTGPVPAFGWLLLVVLLTTPLQSAAEEYVFRGYLSQTIAGWIGSPRTGALVAAVVSALLFAAAHGPQDAVTFLDRFAFGLAASAVVWLTGGLEAAIVLHAVNNVLIFVLAGSLGEGVATEEVPAGFGPLFLLLSLLSMGAFVALVAVSRRRRRTETGTAALDLRPFARPVLTPAG